MVALRRFLVLFLAWSLTASIGISAPTVGAASHQQPAAGQPQGLPPSPVQFNPPAVPQARVGEDFQFSLCGPAVRNVNDLCMGEDALASGGQAPYHFQIDTMGGFPPMGLVLHPNGMLTGKPKAAGPVRFTVCAVDLSGYQNCKLIEVDVQPAAPGGGKKAKGTGGNGDQAAKSSSSTGKIVGVAAAAAGGAVAIGYAASLASQMNNSASGCDTSKAPINEINYYCFGSTRNTAMCNQYIAQYDSFCKSCGFSRFDVNQGGCR